MAGPSLGAREPLKRGHHCLAKRRAIHLAAVLPQFPWFGSNLVCRHCHGHDRVHDRLRDISSNNQLNLHPNGCRVIRFEATLCSGLGRNPRAPGISGVPDEPDGGIAENQQENGLDDPAHRQWTDHRLKDDACEIQ